MPGARYAKLNCVFYDVLTDGGAQSFAETGYSAAPLMRAVAGMLNSRSCSDLQGGLFTDGRLHVWGAIRMPLYSRLSDFASNQKN